MAVSYDRIARDIVFTLENKSAKIFQNMFLNNGCLVLFGSKVKVVTGSNRFDERVNLGQNSNVDWRDKYTNIPVAFQNNWQTAYYGQALIDGTVPINLVEEAQNAGQNRIDDLASECVKNLTATFANKIAAGLMATSESALSPLSLKVQLPATAYGSQTQTTGGIVRSDYPGVTDKTQSWQTQYLSPGTAVDLSAAAGISTATKFAWQCSPGGSSTMEQPDFGITSLGVMAQASGGADVLKRYGTSDKSITFGFDAIKINNAVIIADGNAQANAILFLNTNYAHIQVLGAPGSKTSGEVKVIGDGAVNVPINVRPAIEAYDYLNYVIKAWCMFNLTFGGLRQHGRLANVTEA